MPSHEQFLGKRPELVRYAVPKLHQVPELGVEQLCMTVDLCAANHVVHDVEAVNLSFNLSVERGLEVAKVAEFELCDGEGTMVYFPMPLPVPLHEVPTLATPLFPLASARRDDRYGLGSSGQFDV